MTGLDAPCAHRDAVPVELSTGETVAALCPACDVRLNPEAVGCEHEPLIEITALGERWRSYFCSKCHSAYGDGSARGA